MVLGDGALDDRVGQMKSPVCGYYFYRGDLRDFVLLQLWRVSRKVPSKSQKSMTAKFQEIIPEDLGLPDWGMRFCCFQAK